MMFVKFGLLLSALLAVPALAAYPVRQIYQYPNKTFVDIENIAVRSNGQLLLNFITAPEIHLLDPAAKHPSPKMIHKFPNATSMTGITEIAPDVFAVVVGTYEFKTKAGKPGSFGVWSVDMTTAKPTVKKVASLPNSLACNGAGIVAGSPDMVLVADSGLGAIWGVNMTSGASRVVIQDPLLGKTATFPLGINGVHTQGRTMYFTNSALGIFGNAPIALDGTLEGNISIIAKPGKGEIYDDFALDQNGNAWITNHPNAVTQVTLRAKQLTVGGGGKSTQFIQPTALAFGRGAMACTLYVVTAGSATNTTVASGQVLAMKVC